MHVAVLDTDVPVPQVYAKHGLYGTRFRTLLQAAAARLKQTGMIPDTTIVHTTAYDACHGVYPAEQNLRTSPNGGDVNTIDAILITGSVKAIYDGEPWMDVLQQYIQHVFDRYPLVKIFGSCFGHQAIADVLLRGSVRVEKCPMGHEAGIVPIALDERFCQAVPHVVAPRQNDESGNKRRKNRLLRLQLVHGDWVVPKEYPAGGALPPPWLNLGSTEMCPVHGLYYPGRVLTLQGHFEFDSSVNSQTVRDFGARLGWESSVLDSWLQQINISAREGRDDDDDSQAAAEVVLLFFLSLQ